MTLRKYYKDGQQGSQNLTIQEAEELGVSRFCQFVDLDQPDLQRRVVLEERFVAYKNSGHPHHWHIELLDGSALPNELSGNFTSLSEVEKAVTKYIANSSIKKGN